jgi:hypothetical protein
MASVEVTTLLAAIRQCVTVVEPGEVLAVRVSENAADDYLDELNERARDLREVIGVRVVFIQGEEFARLRAGTEPDGSGP